jgi:uncharacterized protein
VREALDRGHHVTVVARDPSKVGERDQRLDLVQGDVLERDQIATAVEGQDVVVSAVGSAREATPGASLYLRAGESLVRALRGLGEGAPPLVVVGGVGSLRDAEGRLLLERVPEERRAEHVGQKAALDFYRTVSDVRWTYVSPPGRIEPGEVARFASVSTSSLSAPTT